MNQLRQFGSIKHESIHHAYMEKGRELTQMVLEDNVCIVFCTVTACQSAALYKVHGADNEIEWAFPAKSAFLEKQCVKHLARTSRDKTRERRNTRFERPVQSSWFVEEAEGSDQAQDPGHRHR